MSSNKICLIQKTLKRRFSSFHRLSYQKLSISSPLLDILENPEKSILLTNIELRYNDIKFLNENNCLEKLESIQEEELVCKLLLQDLTRSLALIEKYKNGINSLEEENLKISKANQQLNEENEILTLFSKRGLKKNGNLKAQLNEKEEELQETENLIQKKEQEINSNCLIIQKKQKKKTKLGKEKQVWKEKKNQTEVRLVESEKQKKKLTESLNEKLDPEQDEELKEIREHLDNLKHQLSLKNNKIEEIKQLNGQISESIISELPEQEIGFNIEILEKTKNKIDQTIYDLEEKEDQEIKLRQRNVQLTNSIVGQMDNQVLKENSDVMFSFKEQEIQETNSLIEEKCEEKVQLQENLNLLKSRNRELEFQIIELESERVLKTSNYAQNYSSSNKLNKQNNRFRFDKRIVGKLAQNRKKISSNYQRSSKNTHNKENYN
ncbi:hypothetical protein M0813_15755 [Anaeramoeba flamelloides]|uniref:Uncharacterized protein n=1 Tax=Anaeramoeba flamelloides TaxID=1746091 RepID=A0ABQ8Z245_9EUKA|nr:hypothetical protein M0813_15755 [Anaeramoeba flamelloides]